MNSIEGIEKWIGDLVKTIGSIRQQIIPLVQAVAKLVAGLKPLDPSKFTSSSSKFNGAIDGLKDKMGELVTGLKTLHDNLVPIGALFGLVGLLMPFIKIIKNLGEKAAKDLKNLPGIDGVIDPVRGPLQVVADVEESLSGSASMINKLNDLMKDLQGIVQDLENLKVKP